MRASIATEAAAPNHPNEDFAAVTSTLAVILDGAAIPATAAAQCPHDTRWFSRTLGTQLLIELGSEPPVWIAEGVARAIDVVASRHATTCEIDDATHPAATIAILRELPDVYEYYILGDSTIVFDMAAGELAARSDKRLKQLAAKDGERLLTTHAGTPEREPALVDLMHAQHPQRNVRGGYWIASTNPDAAARGFQGHVNRKELLRAALLSDGAAAAVERYDLMDWRSALDAMEEHGPQAIIRATREAENSDPDTERWPRSKVHDDATAIFWTRGATA
jgi:hypothetical protein